MPQFSGSGTFDISSYQSVSVPEFAMNWYSDYVKSMQFPIKCELFQISYDIGFREQVLYDFIIPFSFYHEINYVDSKGKLT